MDILISLLWCILGIAGGAVVTAINNKRKRLTRKIFSINLISEKVSSINGLEIKYNFQSIKNLYSSTIQIKNTGNITINNADIPKKKPLSIYTDGIFIIDKINIQLPSPNNENDIHVTFYKNEKGISSSAIIDFEYISPKQVINITLLHTGKISLGKWMIKDGKVLESNEILDQNDSQNSHIIFKPLYFSVVTIITIILFNILNTYKTEVTLQNLKEDNYRMSNYIEDLKQEIQNLEYDMHRLNKYSLDNDTTIQ